MATFRSETSLSRSGRQAVRKTQGLHNPENSDKTHRQGAEKSRERRCLGPSKLASDTAKAASIPAHTGFRHWLGSGFRRNEGNEWPLPRKGQIGRA